MDSKLLIDAVVRQTTLLIAQLATSAGLRAPLAHLADQVFIELAREIEQQGVSKKVAADMFGLALRGYQRKVARLSESQSVAEKTLWQAVLEFVVGAEAAVTRTQLLAHFSRDTEADVVAVLSDLVASGMLYSTGRGQRSAYGATSGADQEALLRERTPDTLLHLVWLELASLSWVSRRKLADHFTDHETFLDEVLAILVADGRVQTRVADGEVQYQASKVLIPVGAQVGWETAVFDHFRAVCTALISKLNRPSAAEEDPQLVGGTTWAFEVDPGHPFEGEVKGLLARVREDIQALWQRVSDHNTTHPPNERTRQRVIFYAGQNTLGCDVEDWDEGP